MPVSTLTIVYVYRPNCVDFIAVLNAQPLIAEPINGAVTFVLVSVHYATALHAANEHPGYRLLANGFLGDE